jgi:hypothetical protein
MAKVNQTLDYVSSLQKERKASEEKKANSPQKNQSKKGLIRFKGSSSSS